MKYSMNGHVLSHKSITHVFNVCFASLLLSLPQIPSRDSLTGQTWDKISNAVEDMNAKSVMNVSKFLLHPVFLFVFP